MLTGFLPTAALCCRAFHQKSSACRPGPSPLMFTRSPAAIQLGYFSGYEAATFNLGDLVVSLGSALAGADTTKVISCAVTFEVGVDSSGFAGASLNNLSNAQQRSLTACYHAGMLSNVEVINDVIGTVQNAIEPQGTARSVDLSGFQITQTSLEPISPNTNLFMIKTLETDRPSILAAAQAEAAAGTSADAQASVLVEGFEDCGYAEWCPVLPTGPDETAAGPFVHYRGSDEAASPDFVVLYPANPYQALTFPKTDRGIGAGATKQDVMTAYADVFVWDWTVTSSQTPPSPDTPTKRRRRVGDGRFV
ncbi:hypothetical protein E3O06_11380 [Cryobacterium glaciale]|uniref:Uncharacterized protein n=1 Tax=Cryobacterium glaciale TaxID=1259145 RepID=A0A4R8UWI2_9MICO|nr:hypothetical protein [Cryobacterium glaciale]TFB71857.1 hypothetical protein E3O06_11380 [Cryobacterium glaciale]